MLGNNFSGAIFNRNKGFIKGDDYMKLDKGLIQVYTGDGKGKTTAAIGQGIRAYGNGLKVIMVQFLKSGYTGELKVIEELGENFKLYRFEKKRDFIWNLSDAEIEEVKQEVRQGFEFVKEVIAEGKCDVLILDEMMGVLSNGFITVDELKAELLSKKTNMEIVLTGRNVPEEIVEAADLVTEMKLIKHPFEKGIGARKGIEY